MTCSPPQTIKVNKKTKTNKQIHIQNIYYSQTNYELSRNQKKIKHKNLVNTHFRLNITIHTHMNINKYYLHYIYFIFYFTCALLCHRHHIVVYMIQQVSINNAHVIDESVFISNSPTVNFHKISFKQQVQLKKKNEKLIAANKLN